MGVTNGVVSETAATGRPVDVEVVPRAHAVLSASSAERWINCTPSARLEEAVADQHSTYAGDGTAAHAFAELRLRYLLKQIVKREYLAGYEATELLYADFTKDWDASDWEAIDSYVNYVRSEAKRLEADVYIEARVDYSKYAEGGFGTSDALLVSEIHSVIKSIDLKFGKGVPVYAENNIQAKLYALGGLIKFDPNHKIQMVEWAIVQPRLDYIGEDDDAADMLIKWAEDVVAPAAKLAWEGKGDKVPGDWCRFCKIAATCRARVAENVLIARRDFMPVPDVRLEEHTLDMDEVARILPQIDDWMAWANKLKAYALESVRDREQEIDGYKLVRGRANRVWTLDKDIASELKALGVSEIDIFVSPEPSVRSVAQLEKQVGKKSFAPMEKELVIKPFGVPTLVLDGDPREPVNRIAEAQKDFAIPVAE